MLRRHAVWLVGLALAAGFHGCGPSEEELALAQLEQDMAEAHAVIDSLNYTVESSNLLINDLRAQVDSTQEVNEKLLASVQNLSREVREWRQLATEYRQSNERLTGEIAQLREARQADQRTIAALRNETDSLTTAMMEAHTNIRRQSDQIRQMEEQLTMAHDEADMLRRADRGISLFVGSEDFLRANGYLDVSRSFGRALRRVYRMTANLDPSAPDVRVVEIGESFVIEGNLDSLVDRYGKLDRGNDYRVDRINGAVTVTFINNLLGGADVVAILRD